MEQNIPQKPNTTTEVSANNNTQSGWQLFLVVALIFSVLVNSVGLYFYFFSKAGKKILVESSLPEGAKKVLNVKNTFQFEDASVVDQDHRPFIANLVPTYAKKGETEVNGLEFNEKDAENLIVIEEGIVSNDDFIVLSIGRYVPSSSYDGIVLPFCENKSCGYSYGGLPENQAKIVVNIEFVNNTSEDLVLPPSFLQLIGKEKVLKQWKFDRTIEPYSSVYAYFDVAVSAEEKDFSLKLIKDPKSNPIENLENIQE